MNWSWYETFSVLSGLTLMVIGARAGGSVKDRAFSICGGVALVVYAFYVASQDSGIYYFPRIVVLLPFALAAVAVIRVVQRRKAAADRGRQ
jgi:hypothetical protein